MLNETYIPTITYQEKTPKRIDKFLAEKYPEFSRRFFQDGLRNKEILINGKSKSPSYKLKEGDKIEIKLSLKKPVAIAELPPNEKVKVDIVAKYPDFLIINKPVGLVVHPSVFDVRNNSIPPTLAGGLIAKFPELQKVGEDFTRPGIVHRLDKNTSGLMIVPLTQKAFGEFKKMFRHHLITKTYLALSWNLQKGITNPKNYKEPKLYKTIASPIGKSTKEHTKQATAKNPERLINPKEAITLYKIIGYDKFPCLYKIGKIKKQEKTVALIKAKPQTGRKHQIRVHLSSIGLPLVGDSQYTSRLLKNCNKRLFLNSDFRQNTPVSSNACQKKFANTPYLRTFFDGALNKTEKFSSKTESKNSPNFPHHLLHAHKLEFTYRGEKYSFTAPKPDWLESDS